jgi:amino acid transporter, AAT family
MYGAPKSWLLFPLLEETMSHDVKPKFKQPLTGIISFITFFLIAWGTWFIFSDPRGPFKLFPYPFVMYLAVMILVGLWHHMALDDWPYKKMKQPLKGIVLTIVNLLVTFFVIHVIFYRILGLGFNFLSQSNLNALAEAGKAITPSGQALTLDFMKSKHLAESAVVAFVLIGFFSYPFVTILFGKWPIRPSNLEQPQAGFAEIGWASLLTLFFYVILIVPFFGMVFSKSLGSSIGFNTPWWGSLNGTNHLHWVFGWWEWAIIALFMTANVWRGKPWTLIKLPQPLKGIVATTLVFAIGYMMALLCINIIPLWIGADTIATLKAAKPHNAEYIRFLWYHSAEIAGFTLVPFLIWHHYFEDKTPFKNIDSWAAFTFRTIGVLVIAAISYILFYYANFGHWGLGNSHMTSMSHRFIHGESLVWNFWWIIPLLWNDWYFGKWGFFKANKA